MSKTGRLFNSQQTHYLRKRIDFNSAASGTGVLVGTLPANAQVTSVSVCVTTAFNAATNNFVDVGTLGSASALVGHGSVTATAVGVTSVAPASLGGVLSASGETDLYATYTQSGTAATAGSANIVVHYAADNDG